MSPHKFRTFAVPVYEDWFGTRHLLQNLTQMMGKVKLACLPTQPEWAQVLLPMSARGVTTGLVPFDTVGANSLDDADVSLGHGFELRLDLAGGVLHGQTTEGKEAILLLDGTISVADVYTKFQAFLNELGLTITINTRQQEMATTFTFEEDVEAYTYEAAYGARFFEMLVFAHKALSTFLAPFRGKKHMPHFFWGTFDLTGILYSGRSEPFPWEGTIEKTAFDECSVEFGFWPGDQRFAQPAFFVLPYPFASDDLGAKLNGEIGGTWNAKLGEFVYPLQELFAHNDPETTIAAFFRETFEIVAAHNDWKNLNWLTKPLL